jgi:hypothetical protein
MMRRVQRDILLNTGGTTTSRIHHGVQNNDPTSSSSSSSSSSSGGPATPHAVQAGHDIWLYLAGASRDPAIFGDDADLFRFDRYMSSTSTDTDTDSMKHPSQATSSLSSERQSLDGIPCGLAFGAGAKTCLGAPLVRHIVLTMGEVMVESGLAIEGVVEDFGVRGWLGWEAGVAAEWLAKGLKQLPVQRPRGPVRVEVRRVSMDG